MSARMLPARRLRELLGRALSGVPVEASPPSESDEDLHDYLLKEYVQRTATDERLTDLLLSVSSLGIASQEDWLRLKKICFAHLSCLSCRTVNNLFVLLVENSACGHVESVKLQEKLVQLDFLKHLRGHECLQAICCVTNVGSRMSPSFIPHALEVIQKLVKECQTELLPTLSYSVCRLLTSKENKGVPVDIQHSILRSLLERIKSIDYMLLSQTEVVYLFWSLSTFCSPIESLRSVYLRTCEALLTRGMHVEAIKRAKPADLLLLHCSLCLLLGCSDVRDLVFNKETGLIVDIVANNFRPENMTQELFKRILALLDTVVFSFIHLVARGKLQNRQVVVVALEMLSCSGASKLLKNAQILFHLLLRFLLYEGRDTWFFALKRADMLPEEENWHPLVNYCVFDQRMEFFDLLTTRLNPFVLPFACLHSLEKASSREVIAVLEALVYANLSEHFRKVYLNACIRKLPRVIRSVSQSDLVCIVNAVLKLHVYDKVITQAIRDRCEELGVKDVFLHNDEFQEGDHSQKIRQEKSIDDWNSNVITLHICEKALQLSENNDACAKDLTELLENLSLRRGMGSASKTHSVSIIKSLSKCGVYFKDYKEHHLLFTSFFRRVGANTSFQLMLSLILDGAKSGVSRQALLNSLLWVGSRILESGLSISETKDVATYFIAAHELSALDIAFYPAFMCVFHTENALEFLSPHIACRLFAALCALGIDDGRLLEQILKKVTLWCSVVISKVQWSEKDWKAALVVVHALWSLSSEVVKDNLMRIAQELTSAMIERNHGPKAQEYSLDIIASAATIIIYYHGGLYAPNKFEEDPDLKIVSGFLAIVTSLFSEDGLTLSLTRVDALVRTTTPSFIVPQRSKIICLLMSAHAVQRLIQHDYSSSKRLTPLGVSLWRYCVKHVEKASETDNTLLNTMVFLIRFGASSQAFDRCMSTLMEKESDVSMLLVCSVADGLVRTGKRRPVATQFVAHFSQKKCLDDLPAAALLSLLSFFTRDAERVALGLTRTNMLVALVWSSLVLRMERLPRSKELWTLVQSVPLDSRSPLLRLLSERELIDNSSAMELLQPVSTVLNWQLSAENSGLITNFFRTVKASLDNRQRCETTTDVTAKNLLKEIVKRL